MNTIRYSIFKIIEWVSSKETNTYLFVGTDKYKTEIGKLKTNKITKAEEDKLKEYYSNYDLLKTTIQNNDETYIIYENIFDYDNIYTLKQKICMYIYDEVKNDSINDKHLYLWTEQIKNEYEIIDILSSIFNNKNEIEKKELLEIFEYLFKFELNVKDKFLNITKVHDIIKNNKINKIYIPLEINYFDNTNNQKFIKSKPFGKLMNLNNKFVKEDGDYIPAYEFRLDNFSVLKNKVSTNIINFTTSNNLLDACKKSKKLQKEIDNSISEDGDVESYMFNGCIKQYFPYLTYKDLNKAEDYNETDAEIIKSQDNRIVEVLSKQNSSKIYSSQMLINRMHMRIYPNLNNSDYRLNNINLETIFNTFETSNQIPFVSYKKKSNNLYKINKTSLGVKVNEDDIKIDEEDIKEWTQNNTSRKIESLSFKLLIKNENSLKSRYCTLNLTENGQIDIIINMKLTESIKLEDVEKSFILINDLINLLNNELNIKLLNINKNLFKNTNLSYIDIVEFITVNNIIFNDRVNSKQTIEKGISYLYPFFDIVKKEDKVITFKYKKTNNYFNLDEIDTLIKKNITLEDNEIIEKIAEVFKKTKTDAKKIYAVKRPILDLNLIKNNRFVKSKLSQGIFIKLNIRNQVEVQFITKGLQDIENNNIITNLLSIISSDNSFNKKQINNKERVQQDKLLDRVMQNLLDYEEDKNETVNNSNSTSNSNLNNININNNNLNDIQLNNNNVQNNDENNLQGGDNSNNNLSNVESIGSDIESISILSDSVDDDLDDLDDVFGDDNIFNNLEQSTTEELEEDTEINQPPVSNEISEEVKTKKKDKVENVRGTTDESDPSNEYDLKNLKNIEKDKGYTQLVLKRLQWADKLLTGYTTKEYKGFKTYASHCPAVDKKQPVVLTKEELEFIDKNYRGSYTNFIKTGSNKTLVDKYYYICPKIWCPLSKVSLTDEDLKKNNGKCPEPIGEPPLILEDKKNIWKKEVKGEMVDIPRYPYLLKKNLHPEGFEMPCCGKKDKTKKITDVFKTSKEDKEESQEPQQDDGNSLKRKKDEYTKRINEKYIRKIHDQPVEANKYATLPNKLSNIFGNIGKTHGLITDRTNAFVRKGIESNNQNLLSTLISLMNNDNLKTLEDLYNLVDKNMSILDYIELNNGNTLKLYLNTDNTIYEKENFKNFKKWINNKNNEEYIKLMNLENVVDKLQTMNEFQYEDNNISKSILREYLIYNSFENFKYYLKSDIVKNHEEILQLFTNNYSWLNVNEYNIVVINVEFINNKENIEILCSKFIDYKNKINNLKDFVFVLKLKNSYEPIVKVQFISGDIIEDNSFNYFDNVEIQKIVSLQKNNCNNLELKEYINPIRLYNEIELLKYQVKHVVLNMSFKVVGYILNNNLYVPLNSAYYSSNVFKGTDITPSSFVYLQDIPKYSCKLTLTKIKNIFTSLNENLKTNFYDVDKSDVIENKKDITNKNVAIILENGLVIPLNVTKEYQEIIIESLNDEFIFIGADNPNEAKSYLDNYAQKEIDYNNKLKVVVNYISTNLTHLKQITNLKNKYNPFPKNIKFDKITKVVKEVQKKTNLILSEHDITNIVDDIYSKDLFYILNKNNKKLKLTKDEIVFNQEDINNEKLEKLFVILLNPYKYIENSIEDYVYYRPIQLNTKLIKYKFITDIFLDIKPSKWENMLPSFKINEPILDENTNTQDTKNYFLSIFKKIAELSNKKITLKNLEKHIENQREKDFEENNILFVEEQRINTYFMREYNKLVDSKENTDGVYTYNNINKIFKDSNYKYSHYEIKVLSKYLNINVILLGKNNSNKLPGGVRCFNNKSNKYLLFNIDNITYDRYNIILKNKNKFVLEKNDFPKRFITDILNKYCEKIIIEENNNDE